ncbi:MAG: PAS domain S-box protein [Bacteroidales bacterium]|nr:PAS domain S-box protein [Bacteroidales bacterium]MCF8459017.1 PAS domain S-box protein [Bacteroidales bacterium]
MEKAGKSENSNIRQKAEDKLKRETSKGATKLSEADTLKLIHELEVHQIELELQNEELRQAKSEAQKAIDKYTELYDFAPSGYFTMSKKGEILDLNLQGAKMLGEDRSQLKNNLFVFFVSSETKHGFDQFLKNIYRNKKNETCDLTIKGKGTLPKYVHLTGIAAEKGSHCLISVIDISEMKQAEHTLKIKERFDLAMNASKDGLFDWNLETNEIYYSPGWKRMLGYKEEELPNDFRIWEKLTNPHDVERCWKMQQALINKQCDRFELEFKMKHKDGHWVDILSRAEAFFDDHGKAIRIVGTHVDISERKQAEDELRNSMQIIEGIMNSIPIRVFWKDLNLVYLGCNKAFAADAGFPNRQDIIGKDDYQMCWRDQAELYRNDDREVIKSGVAKIHIEEPQTTPDGKIIYLLTSKIPLRNSHGEVIGVLGTYLDITERKKTEKELAQYRHHLEELVKERTAELEEKNKELENFNQLFVGRELRIMDLKDKLRKLENNL